MHSTTPLEVVFDRQVRQKYARGWADLQAPGALGTLDVTSEQLEFLIFFREAMNGALANAKIVPVHVVNGPYHFDWIDSDEQDAFAFSAGDYSFIGVTTGFAKWVFGAGSRLCASELIWDFLGLDANQTPANNVEFVLVYLALAFIVAHEYCHHVLGHQPGAIPESDPRTASLRGNLQSHTREVGADGYAAMHQYDFVIHSDFRSQMVSLLGIGTQPVPTQDRVLFSIALSAVASTWYRLPPAALTVDNIFFLSHPPRAVRLSFFMEHAMIWARAFRPSLEHVIDGQGFANMMHFIGAAVCAAHADSTAQNGFMRSKAGQEYQQALADNLALHKSRMANS